MATTTVPSWSIWDSVSQRRKKLMESARAIDTFLGGGSLAFTDGELTVNGEHVLLELAQVWRDGFRAGVSESKKGD